MKVRISAIGNLEIFRMYDYKTQTCCYHQFKACGDHCPHFVEPYKALASNGNADMIIYIQLCQNRELTVDTKCFQDLRSKQETEYDYKFYSINYDGGDDN